MRNRQFEKFISNSLQVETQANRMDETISTCVNIMRKQAVVCEEEPLLGSGNSYPTCAAL